MKRRQFLKLSGAMAAGGALSSCQGNAGELIPLLVPPDDGSIPGVADYYASTCLQCPAGCGIHVRVFEGRARKVEGNPEHPVNRGRLCARGQAALQELYHPDRVTSPMQRKTGEDAVEPATWEAVTERIGSRLRELSEKPAGSVLLFTPPLQGISLDIARRFAEATRAEHVQEDPLNTLVHLRVAEEVFGTPALPDYDFAEAQFVLSLGADLLETFQSPVRFAGAYGRMRRHRPTVRGLFAYAGPRMSQTAACADEWLPVKPGTEGILAAGIARFLIDQEMYDRVSVERWGVDLESQFSALEPFGPERVAEETDLPLSRVVGLARDFGRLRPSMALAGDGPGIQTNGMDTVRMAYLLNILSGAMGLEVRAPVASEQPVSLPSSLEELMHTIQRMGRGEVLAAFFMNTNPLVTLPASSGFRQALAEVPFIVSMNTLPNDMSALAHIILPSPANLESWHDVIPLIKPPGVISGLAQPVVAPLHDVRAPEDVLLALSRKVTGRAEEEVGMPTLVDHLKERVAALTGRMAGTADEQWVRALQKGGLWTGEHESVLRPPSGALRTVRAEPPAFSGNEQEYPFILNVYLAPLLLDGRSAELPWLQETPDPMTTVQWGSWVEVNPVTAAQLGVRHGDWVKVESSVTGIELPVVIFPGIRPDVVAIPRGQGAEAGGRYSKGRGVNPMMLVSMERGRESDLPAWGATRVRLKKVPSGGVLVTSGDPSGSYRGELIGL